MKRTILTLIAGGTLAAACGGGSGGADAPIGDDTTNPDAPVNNPDAAPPFTISDVINLSNGTQIDDSPPELNSTAVLPDHDYLVWVGAYQLEAGGAPPTLPKDYGITVCGRTFSQGAAACDYTEAHEATNDATAEASGQTVGATPFVLCGKLDAKAPVMQTIDRDRFRFTVPAAGARVEFRISSSNPVAQTVMAIEVYKNNGAMPPSFVGDALFLGTAAGGHGVTSLTLDAGQYQASPILLGQAQPATDVDYKVTVSTDDIDTRCAMVAGNPTYTEANDGAANTGNDLIEVNFSNPPPHALTTATTDVPEATGITVDATTPIKLAGTLADGTTHPDEYKDRDTFLIHTGPTTNQLEVRVQWPDTPTPNADLDYFLWIPVP